MSLADVTLKDYDNVVAVTQLAINQTMAEYLQQHPKDMAIYANEDDEGNLIIISDSSKASYILTGTLALEKDTDGNYIKLVKLQTDRGNQTVLYNVTVQDGEFKNLEHGKSYKQKTTPWVFSFFVSLAMQEIGKKDLPNDAIQRLPLIDENVFSIQQLYMDLNTAALNSMAGVKMPSGIKSLVSGMMAEYLKQQQKKGKPLFGISVVYKDKKTLPPTFAPTYVNFCVTPYYSGKNNSPEPDLDTLNYLVMTDHNKPPAYAPKSFLFNWVEDKSNHGAMAIKRDLFVKFIVKELNPILKTLCPRMHCKAENLEIKLKSGSEDREFKLTYNADSHHIASYFHETSDYNSWRLGTRTHEAEGKYSSTTNIYLKDDKIQISGSIEANATVSMQDRDSKSMPDTEETPKPMSENELPSTIAACGNVKSDKKKTTENLGWKLETVMPKTTFKWSVDLQLYMDLDKNGQLSLKIVNENFNAKPTTPGKPSKSWWEDFLDTLNGKMKSYTTELGNMRGYIQKEITGALATRLNNILNNASHFVFPGAKTFAFKNPTFSKNHDLTSNITYLNPNA